ncbi:MAG: hypothetical protein Q4P20_05325 [Eubacteriales bacterium]|nr:hypothetical protein [Eubacteriales bacterium]
MLHYSDVERLVREHQLTYFQNIVFATVQPSVKFIIPAGPFSTVIFDKVEQYLVHFSAAGMRLFPVPERESQPVFLPWKSVTRFRVKRGLITYRLIVETAQGRLRLIVNKFVLGNAWAGENTAYLAEHDFFYPQQ